MTDKTSTRTMKRDGREPMPMRRWSLLAGALLLAAALAGCIGPGEGDANAGTQTDGEPIDPASEPEEPSNETTSRSESDPAGDESPKMVASWFNGSVQGQHTPVLGHACMLTCDNQFTFNVTDNTTALVAEIAWEASASLMFDLDIPYEKCDASMMDDCPPASVSGSEGYLEIRLTDPAAIETGEWATSAWAEDSPTEAIAFTIAVTQVHGGEAPQDHSQIDPP